MKCLTVCQPYADALILGPKRVENRKWKMKHRGPLLIHAGKNKSFLGLLSVAELDSLANYPLDHAFGEIIGAVDVIDCLTIDEYRLKKLLTNPDGNDPWACGPNCIITENPRRLIKPIPYFGALGLYDVPDELLANAEWIGAPL